MKYILQIGICNNKIKYVYTMISTALLLDSIIRNSVCTPAKLPCRRVEVGYKKKNTAKG
jgi:hypothetical protein